MLTERDLHVDDMYNTTVIRAQEEFHVLYVIEMSSLALIRMSVSLS